MSGLVVHFLVVVGLEVPLDRSFNLLKTTEKRVQVIAPELNHVIQSIARNQVMYSNLYLWSNPTQFRFILISMLHNIFQS